MRDDTSNNEYLYILLLNSRSFAYLIIVVPYKYSNYHDRAAISCRGGTILIFGSDPDSDSRIGTFFQDRRFDPDSDSGIESVSGSDSNRIFPILAILAIDSGNFELVKKNL